MKKPRYTVDQIKEALAKTRGMITQAAVQLGCDPSTIYEYLKVHPELREAITMEREKMGDIAELALYRAVMNGEHWAIGFYLGTQHKKRGYVQRQEVTGADGNAQEVKHTIDLKALDDKDLEDLERITRKSTKSG